MRRIVPVVRPGQRVEVLSTEEAVDLLAVVPRRALKRNQSVGYADRNHREPKLERRRLSLEIHQFERGRRGADEFGRGLEQRIFASVRCVIAGDNIP